MLLDIGLPEMNGYDVAMQLRRDGTPNRIRLIALTGYGQAGDLARATEAGFDDHLMKPVEWPALQRALEGGIV
jgi:CheY-like chemotaxis protein